MSIVGFGAFGRFIAPHLRAHFDVIAHDRGDISAAARDAGVRNGSLEQAAAASIVVLAVPVQNLESVLLAAAPHVRSDALVIDVCSVKLSPLEMMLRALPASASIVGLHPLFGPQSGKDGVAGLPIAVCPARASPATVECVRGFLRDRLALRIIETTPDEHDRQMAYVQALTHFVSRAVGSMDLPGTPMATRAYERFLAMKSDLQNDSFDLFLTIQQHNPYAARVREELMRTMEELERAIRAR